MCMYFAGIITHQPVIVQCQANLVNCLFDCAHERTNCQTRACHSHCFASLKCNTGYLHLLHAGTDSFLVDVGYAYTTGLHSHI